MKQECGKKNENEDFMKKLTDQFELNRDYNIFFPKNSPLLSFNYSDGQTAEDYIYGVLKNARDKSSFSIELASSIKDWPSLYHLSPQRANLIRALDFKNSNEMKVLELGAGCGAITRYLGENFREIHAIEGSAKRALIARERCSNLENVKIFNANFLAVDFAPEYDLVSLIGVLEYSTLYHPNNLFSREEKIIDVLKRAFNSLNKNGKLVLAIENKFGLKYWAGSHEDHTNNLFEGIMGYPGKNTPITFSRNELKKFLHSAGFKNIQFFLTYPDYKIPTTFLNGSIENFEEFDLHNWIETPSPDRAGYPRNLFHEALALRELNRARLIREFANSFLIVANKQNQTEIISWVAKSFSAARHPAFATETLLRQNPLPSIEKKKIFPNLTLANSIIKQIGINESYFKGDLWVYELYESIARNTFEPDLTQALKKLNNLALKRFGRKNKTDDGFPVLDGRAFDFVFWNIIHSDEYHYFDGEWEYLKTFPIDYLLFRNIFHFMIRQEFYLLNTVADSDDFIIKMIGTIYPKFNKNRLEKLKEKEEEVMSFISWGAKKRASAQVPHSVSIIIPVFNQLNYTRQCAEAIFRTTSDEFRELIFVDNGSSDDTGEYLNSLSGNVKVLHNERNLGFAKACNQGAQAASGEMLLFLNNDTIPQQGWLEPLLQTLRREGVGIVGSKLVFPDKTIQHAGVVFAGNLLPYHIYEGLPEHLDFLNREEEYSAVTGACLGIRKELFFQIGMFDEAYLNGLEDIDLCLKIKKLGKKVIYQPKSELIHFASRTEGRQNHMPRNRQIFLNKWRQWICRDDFHYYLKNHYIPSFGTMNAEVRWVHYEKPLISIIIVTYNSEKTLENCLKSIDGNMTTLYEIILVDNASKKDVRKVIEPFESKLPLSIIQNSQNLGFSAAANQGIKQAQGDYIVLLNPDTVVTQEWGVRLMRHFSSDTGAVGPISNYAAGRQNFSHYADRRWQGDFSLEKLSTFIYDKNKGQSVETKLLIGFCLMIKREAVEKAGLLDENLFLGNDDLDYSLRLREAGYKLKIAADTFIYHEGQHSFKMLEAEKKAALMQESLDRFYEKLETKFGEGRVPSSTELWGIDILGTPTRRKNGRRHEPLLTPKKEASFLKKRRVALIYDNQVRPDTTGEYCSRALQSICKVTHFLPDDMDKIRPGAFDLYLFIDDGLEYPIPFQLRPNAWWVIDTHLRYEKDLEKARLFDYVFAAQRDGAEKLERDGIRNVFWLPLAADPSVHKKYALPKKYDVSFVGHLAPGQRNELLQAIRETVPNRFIGQKFFDEMARIYSESKIVFNRSLKNDINMRVFEAMATGSLLLTNDLADNGLEVLFKTGEQVAVYSGKNDLLRKIEYYLKHPDERERTAREGRKAILKEHTYPKRMRALLETVLTLETQKPAFSTDKLTSIIVLTCNGIDYTKQCLSSIRENTEAPYELIVVDNGSTDGTRDYLQSLENVKVLLNAENRGFAAGNNRGMREAKGDFIVWLNNDTVVTKGWLKGLIQAVQLSPDAGMAGPRSNYVQNPYQQIKNVPYKTMEDMHRFAGEFSRQHKEVYLTATKLVGFCLLMKRSVMDRVGILDESFGLGNFEDDDYCVRVRKAGYHLIIAGAVFIHHYGNRAFKENDISYKTMMRKNLKKFTEKWKHEIEFRNGVYYLKDDLHNFARAEITTGEKHFARDDLSSARSHFLKAVEWEPKNAQAWNNLGVVHWKETKFQQAFENFKAALTVSPEYSDAQENLLQLAREVDLSDRLVKWCRQMPDAAGNLSLLYEIGKLLLGKNRTAEAQDCFQKILRIRGTSIEGRIGLALVAWERERFDEALQKMDEITGIAPGNKELILQYALMAYQLGQASEAITLLKNYLAAHSDEKMEQTLGFLEEHLREEQTVSTEAAEAV